MKNNGQTQREEADRLFCARIADMARQQQRDNLPCFTRFLDEREQRLAEAYDLSGTDVLPVWVNMHSNNGSREYNILPLDISKEDQWTEMFNLTANNFSSAQASYKRTMDIVGDGLKECQDYLAQAKTDREAYYLDLATNPEKYESAEPTLSVVETTQAVEETTLPAAA